MPKCCPPSSPTAIPPAVYQGIHFINVEFNSVWQHGCPNTCWNNVRRRMENLKYTNGIHDLTVHDGWLLSQIGFGKKGHARANMSQLNNVRRSYFRMCGMSGVQSFTRLDIRGEGPLFGRETAFQGVQTYGTAYVLHSQNDWHQVAAFAITTHASCQDWNSKGHMLPSNVK